mmetsp:Transcript_99344/g.256787  ORF Transcript_99344/g.256787 Transcript_99344/m.256787 type:complete len:611 (-) Transcript_99344:372-2204(-)
MVQGDAAGDPSRAMEQFEAQLMVARAALDRVAQQARHACGLSESRAATLQEENSRLRKELALLSRSDSRCEHLRAAGTRADDNGVEDTTRCSDTGAQNEDCLPPGAIVDDDLTVESSLCFSTRQANTLPQMSSCSEGVWQADVDLDPEKNTEGKAKTGMRSISGTEIDGAAKRGESKSSETGSRGGKSKLTNQERLLLTQDKKSVKDLYAEDGFYSKLAKSVWFEHITLVVIAFNALWIAIDIDNNDQSILAQADWPFQVVAHLFCAFFSFELFVRFMAFSRWTHCLSDRWFVFDAALLLMMVLETWVMSLVVLMVGDSSEALGQASNASVLRILRMLRITRMARMAKLLRAVPELLVMVKGIVAAARSVAVTLLMLITIVYVFGVLFRQIMAGTELGETYFSSVPSAMNTLVGYGIFMEGTPVLLEELGAENFMCWVCFILFALMASFTVLNMLVGVMCETVRTVSIAENERTSIISAKERLEGMLKTSGLDADGDGMISKDELEALVEIPGAAEALADVGVDAVGLVDLTDFIFEEAEELEFPEFMAVVLRLRGSKMATVRDLVDFRRFIHVEIAKVQSVLGLETASTSRKALSNLTLPRPVVDVTEV